MKNTVQKLIDAIDVEHNRDEAVKTVQQIVRLGPEAMDSVMAYANQVHDREKDAKQLRKTIRATVLTLSEFIKTDRNHLERDIDGTSALKFLCLLATQGFKSAANFLHSIGYTDSKILEQRLLMMTRVDPAANDKEISLSEAVEEIFLSQFSAGEKKFKKDRYLLGREGKHIFELYRTAKKTFAIRRKKNLSENLRGNNK